MTALRHMLLCSPSQASLLFIALLVSLCHVHAGTLSEQCGLLLIFNGLAFMIILHVVPNITDMEKMQSAERTKGGRTKYSL